MRDETRHRCGCALMMTFDVFGVVLTQFHGRQDTRERMLIKTHSSIISVF